MGWFKRWLRGEPLTPPHQGPIGEPMDWVVMPYRVAEAARISLYTIASHPELPDSLRWWIAQWLAGYNAALAGWFEQHYGPDVFPMLAQITMSVRSATEQAVSEEHARAVEEAFSFWEQQLGEEHHD